MDEVKKVKPKTFDPKQLDENGYDKDGILHDKCGTPDCCGGCDTAVEDDESEL